MASLITFYITATQILPHTTRNSASILHSHPDCEFDRGRARVNIEGSATVIEPTLLQCTGAAMSAACPDSALILPSSRLHLCIDSDFISAQPRAQCVRVYVTNRMSHKPRPIPHK